MYESELLLAKTLALKSGVEIMKIYDSDFETYLKKDSSPVTAADLLANKIIISGIKKSFPDDAILSEESVDDFSRLKKSRVWIIDPIDGTKEFISKNGEFTINIALVEDSSPVLGVIFAPSLNELYFSSINSGAFLLKDGLTRKISSSKKIEISKMVIVRSRSHVSKELLLLIKKAGFLNELSVGSSLKGCFVASGKADVYFRLGPTNEWDICAMNSILSESGALLTDFEGKVIKFNNVRTLIKGFVVSNNMIHKNLLHLI